MGLAGVVLFIACLNIANMLLARGSARRKEIAIRLAVGGARGRIVRQLLTEGLLLAFAGAAGGLLLAYWTTEALAGSLASVMPLAIQFDPRPDAAIMAATDWICDSRDDALRDRTGAEDVARRSGHGPQGVDDGQWRGCSAGGSAAATSWSSDRLRCR